MSKYNADEVFGVIEVILDGKTYSIKSISQETLEEIKGMTKEIGEDDYRTVYKQLGLLLGCPADEFIGKDIRKLTGILRHIQRTMSEQIETKNV